MKVKEKDYRLFRALRQDGRMSLTDLSKRTEIPISTIYERLRQLKEQYIRKHTILLDFKKIGFNVRLHFICKAEKKNKKELQKYLQRTGQINNVYRINHGYDFLCEGIFEDMRDAEQFLENLEVEYRVKKIESFYILEILKQEGFFSD